MNFWEFKEDHSQGYWLPASNKAARDHGGQLVSGLFFLVISLFRLAGAILAGLCLLLWMILRGIWKLVARSISRT